jgi:hypothetical protein
MDVIMSKLLIFNKFKLIKKGDHYEKVNDYC